MKTKYSFQYPHLLPHYTKKTYFDILNQKHKKPIFDLQKIRRYLVHFSNDMTHCVIFFFVRLSDIDWYFRP